MTNRVAGAPDRALTILEILALIAVFVLLAAAVFPAYQKVKENTAVRQDLSNLRQLGAAVTVYSGEFGYLPGGSWPTSLNARCTLSWKVFKSSFDSRKPADENANNTPVS